MRSEYMIVKDSLERAQCNECKGLGVRNDAEPGDTYFETWTCPTCKGSGFSKRGFQSFVQVVKNV